MYKENDFFMNLLRNIFLNFSLSAKLQKPPTFKKYRTFGCSTFDRNITLFYSK